MGFFKNSKIWFQGLLKLNSNLNMNVALILLLLFNSQMVIGEEAVENQISNQERIDLQFQKARKEIDYFGQKIIQCFDYYFHSDIKIEPTSVKKYCSGVHGTIIHEVFLTHVKELYLIFVDLVDEDM